MVLISSPGMRSTPARSAAARAAGRATSVSWSVIESVVMPAAAAASTRATGSSTPSERLVCVWRSTVAGAGGTTGRWPGGPLRWTISRDGARGLAAGPPPVAVGPPGPVGRCGARGAREPREPRLPRLTLASDLDDPLDPLDRERATGGRVDV